MTQPGKIPEAVLRGTSDANLNFVDLRKLLIALEFKERIRGVHHIFKRDIVDEIINIQPNGSLAKAWQVKQVRNIILKYGLGSSL